MMSTEHDFRSTSDQYQFLDKHLKAVNRTRTPWLILGGHRSGWCTARGNRGMVGFTKINMT